MGRSTQQPPAYRDDPDAVSMHTTPDDYSYDDAPEISNLPPSYADSEADSSAAGAPAFPIRHVPPPTTRTDHNNPSYRNGKPIICEDIRCMDSSLDSNPGALEDAVRSYANTAPVPLIYIMGTHKETVKNGDKKETRSITDFRLVLNIQRYLRQNFNDLDTTSMNLVTVENSEKTYRGTITKCKAPGAQNIELGKPSLAEWCHRYCASPRMLRVFRLQRTVPGFDQAYLKNRLEGLIASTSYRGHIDITFPIEDKNVDFYTDNKINQWRNKNWICWIFYLTFLWIFTWPYLFFMTKWYAVVRAEWPFSVTDAHGRKTYATVSEERWFEKWHVGVRRLVLDQFQGEVSEEMMAAVIARPEDPPMPGRTGHAGFDNAVGMISQGFQIARAVQTGGNLGRGMQGGWGYDC